jgi:hypothetical protein
VAGSRAPAGERPPGERPPGDAPRAGSLVRDFTILIAVFAVTVGIAELAGAANLGVSFGIGQVTFAIALVALLTRG